MTSYGVAVTALTREQTVAMMRDLEQEGEGLPDPSREEVDGWLERTITQVKFDQDISEPLRDRILRRLREAIGRVTPTGAQFHAWRNAVAEAWQRSKRRAVVFFAAGVLSFAGGCGVGGGPGTDADPTPSPSVTATAIVPGYEPVSAEPAGPLGFHEGVKEKYGEQQVRDAYAFAADFANTHGFNETVMHQTQETFDPASIDAMRPAMSDRLQGLVEPQLACVTTDASCADAVGGLSAFGQANNGYSLRDDVPSTGIQRQVTDARAFVDQSDGRLGFEFTQKGTLRYEVEGKNVLVDYNRPTTYWVVPNGTGGWLLDGYHADAVQFSGERLDAN